MEMVDSKKYISLICVFAVLITSSMEANTSYKMVFQTCIDEGADTNDKIHVILHGELGGTLRKQNITFQINEIEFKQGRTDLDQQSTIYMDPICSINIWRSGIDPWKLSNLSISVMTQKTKEDEAVFKINNCSKEDDWTKNTTKQRNLRYQRTTPSDGSWNHWGDWGNCLGNCSVSRRYRSRSCDRPCGNGTCTGSHEAFEGCSLSDCHEVKWMLALAGMGVCLITVIVLSLAGALRYWRLREVSRPTVSNETGRYTDICRDQCPRSTETNMAVTNWEYSTIERDARKYDSMYKDIYSLPKQQSDSQEDKGNSKPVYSREIEWSENEMYDKS